MPHLPLEAIRYPRSRFKTRDFIEPSRTPRVDTSLTVPVACSRLGARFAAFFDPARGLGALRFAAIPLLPDLALRCRSVQRSDGVVENGRATWCPNLASSLYERWRRLRFCGASPLSLPGFTMMSPD